MTQNELAQILAGKQAESDLDLLDDREMELISLMSQGTPSHMICQEMGLEAEAVNKLKTKAQKKLSLKNEIQLIQFAAKQRRSSF